MWQAIASSSPPPSAKPLTAAMTGILESSTAWHAAWPSLACARAPSMSMAASSAMSAPAANDGFLPVSAPVRTIAPIACSAFASMTTPRISSSVARDNALSVVGRLIDTTRIGPSRSTLRFSQAFISFPSGSRTRLRVASRPFRPSSPAAGRTTRAGSRSPS